MEKFQEDNNGIKPQFLCRAPGRVNLIGNFYLFNNKKIINRFLKGEHIDYCGYSVLPMAVDQDIISAFSAIDNNEVQISNVNQLFKYSKLILFDKIVLFFFFRAGSFDIDQFTISYEKSNWYEYFKCGVQGIRDKYPDIKLKGKFEVC